MGDQNRPKSSNPNHYIPTRRGRRLATKSMLRKMLLQDIKQELSRRGHDFEGVADFWNKDKWVDVALDIIYEVTGAVPRSAAPSTLLPASPPLRAPPRSPDARPPPIIQGQYEETARQWKDQIETEEAKARNDLKSNAKGLQLLFFGSSLGPSTSRGLPALAARLTRQVLMFSVGEDTQRRFAESLLSPYRVSRIFIPSRNPVFYLGLPGLICTISTSRSGSSSIPAEAEGRSPLRIYAPPGIAEYVHTTLDISNTYVSIPVVIYEFAEGPVSAEELRPRLINPRCRLFRALLPPDDVASTLPRMTDEEEEEFLFGMCYSKQVLDNTAPKEPVEGELAFTLSLDWSIIDGNACHTPSPSRTLSVPPRFGDPMRFPRFADRSVYRQFRPVETEWPATPASNAGPTWTVGIEPQWRVICTRGPQDAPEGRGGMSFILSEADK